MEVNQVYQMDALELLRSLEPASVDAIITDLPYGTTACAWDEVIPFAPMWEAVKRVLKPRGAFVTTASQPFTSALVMSNPKWFRYEWVWEKDNGTNFLQVDDMPFKTHENVLVFSALAADYTPQMTDGTPYRAIAGTVFREYIGEFEKGTTTVNTGDRYPRTVQKFNSERGLHPTQKPQALYEYLIRTYTSEGDLVVDPCSGSGTTAAAAIATGRHYIVGDSDPHYCEVTRQRLLHPSKAELKAALSGKPTTRPMFTD